VNFSSGSSGVLATIIAESFNVTTNPLGAPHSGFRVG
jgi:hypothetical protein